MTLEEFDQLFNRFTATAFHLETHQAYAVSEEDERLRAWRDGRPRPERSVRTSPWLQRIASTTIAGKRWSRVHLIKEPLSEYLRYQLVGYVESQAVGEEIRLASINEYPELAGLGPDMWLFDSGTPGAFGVQLDFDEFGHLIDIVSVDVDGVVELELERDLALDYSVSLAEYLATRQVQR
jgi:uncharacterized protein DUF6879